MKTIPLISHIAILWPFARRILIIVDLTTSKVPPLPCRLKFAPTSPQRSVRHIQVQQSRYSKCSKGWTSGAGIRMV